MLVLSVGGFVGGLLYWTSLFLAGSVNRRQDQTEEAAWNSGPLFCLANVFTGIGGAWAAALAMLWAHRAPIGPDPEALLELLATSIIAGYAGNRLLPAVAERLTSELLKKSAEAAKINAAAAKLDAEAAKTEAEAATRSRLIAEGLAYLDVKGSQTQHQTDSFIIRLDSELRREPQFRQAAILLARMYAESRGDVAKAVTVLEDFIAARRQSVAMDDSNVADAYWNLGNYYEIQFAASDRKDRSLRLKAIGSLAESFRILPSYQSNLMQDPDFQDLIMDPDAKRLLP